MSDSVCKCVKQRFAPWHYHRERAQWEEESRSGWHLTRRTERTMEYSYDPELQYRYAVDYRTGHNEEDYLSFFLPDGWELVGSIPTPFERRLCVTLLYDLPPVRPHPAEGCWYIFRKKCERGLIEADYCIFSEKEELEEKRRELVHSYERYALGALLVLLFVGLVGALAPLAMPAWCYLPYLALAAVIQFRRARCLHTPPKGRALRGLDLGLRILATVLLLAGILGMWGLRGRWFSASGDYQASTDQKPLDFLLAEGYLLPGEEYELYATDTMAIALMADGRSFYFSKKDPADKEWLRPTGGIEDKGYYYTVPVGFSAFEGSCRLMDSEGVVYEPIYEAVFSSGYLPVFALLLPEEEEAHYLLYTLDEAGQPHYGMSAVQYGGFPDWQAPALLSDGRNDWSRVYTIRATELRKSQEGQAFLQGYQAWRESVLAGTPDAVNSGVREILGISQNRPFQARYYYPPCLSLSRLPASGRWEATWLTNSREDGLGHNQSGGMTWVCRASFAFVPELLDESGSPSHAQLQQAAASILDSETYILKNRCYGNTYTYYVPTPENIAALWQAACAANTGEAVTLK